jgi:hypothetical protein
MGRDGYRGMLQDSCVGPQFLFGGGYTKSLSSLLGSVWIFKGCEAFFMVGTFTCKCKIFLFNHFVVWCKC